MKYLLVLLCLAVPGQAQTVKLPPEVKGEPGQFILVRAQADGSAVEWYTPDKGLSVFPAGQLKDPKVTIVVASVEGRYRLLGWTAKGDVPSEVSICIVVIGDAPPTPIPPGPDPAPPSDPLVQALQAAYAAETDAGKAQLKASFAAFYREASNAAQNQALGTWGQLFDTMATAARSMGITGKLPTLQGVIQGELKKVLPIGRDAPLDTAGRKLAADTFNRIATALETVR